MDKPPKILLVGGGTGGHLFPAVAAAQEILDRRPDAKVLFLISDRPMESGTIEYYKFNACVTAASGLKDWRRPLPWLRAWWRCVVVSVRAVRRFKPDRIIGFGGFVSCFPVLIGRLFGVRCDLHEQNLLPGRVTRWLAPWVRRIYVSYEPTRKYFGLWLRRKTVLAGNPIRMNLRKGMDPRKARTQLGLDEKRFTLLVLGGSQGSRALNRLCTEMAARWLGPEGIQVVHQTGEQDLAQVREAYEKAGVRCHCFAFRQEMNPVYSACDVAVSRAGATALAELMHLGLPSVLVPYPHAVNDHQRLNAQYWADRGVAVCLTELNLSVESLWEGVLDMRRLCESGEAKRLFDGLSGEEAPTPFAEALGVT